MLDFLFKPAFTRKQRFTKALVFGITAFVIALVVCLVIFNGLHIYAPILYVGAAFLIAFAICHFSKGVQIQFSILATVLTVLLILICDLTYFGFDLQLYLSYLLPDIFTLFIRLAAIVISFKFSRAV